MNTEPQSPLDSAGEMLGNLQEQAQSVIGDLAENAEKLADSVLGAEKVDEIKAVLNTDVGVLAQDLMDKVQGKDEA